MANGFIRGRAISRPALIAAMALAAGTTLACAAEQPAASAAPAVESPKAPAEEFPSGSWEGGLGALVKLRVIFHIKRGEDGSLTATLDSPDQAARGIVVDEVKLTDEALHLTVKSIGGTFAGRVDREKPEITGLWKQNGQILPLVLKPFAPLKRPQTPQPPLPYAEREVSYENRHAQVKLAGTLTLPRSDKPVPAVLLISGSGSQDRDESLAGHQPFRVLADDLTRRGIAVLRVDDRGIGGSSGDPATSTTADYVDDVLAGVEFLQTCQEIDPQQIGLVGHSEGGLIAPAAAVRSQDIAFIVLIAGPGVTGEEILYAQGALILGAAGASVDAIGRQRKLQQELFTIIKEIDGSKANAEEERAACEKKLVAAIVAAGGTPDDAKRAAAEKQATAQAQSMLSPWFRYFLTYDPRPTLSKVRCPVLAVIGERDLQVPPAQNFPELRKALEAGKNPDFTLRELPELNHLLQPAKTGSPAEYAKIETTIAPVALSEIGDWIVSRTKR